MKTIKQIRLRNLLPVSFFDFKADNVTVDGGVVALLIFAALLILILIYKSQTNWGFKLRKYARLSFSKRDSGRYKELARILFIDDRDIPIAQTLEDDNWKVQKVRDIQIDDQKVKEANIIFVDWKGVGRKISSEAEGIALANNLKTKYGCEKYIILYSAREYQKPEGVQADDWINKGSQISVYTETIQRASFALFG